MLKKAIEQTFKGKFWTFLFGSSGFTFVSFLLLGKNALGQSTKDSVLWGLGVVFVLLFLRFLWFLGKGIVNKIHDAYIDSIWGEAIIRINAINAEIQSLRRKSFSNEDFMRVMVLLCEHLKCVFDLKTKSNCGVSIKVPVCSENEPEESYVLRNLCRDSDHEQRDTEKYKRTKHTVFGNTPYVSIINSIRNSSDQLAYINNNISQSQDYVNTSRACYRNGKLPYNSELVYPIIPLKNDDGNARILGFICIDSDKSNVFDKKLYDIPVVSGIADSVYDIIQKQNNKS